MSNHPRALSDDLITSLSEAVLANYMAVRIAGISDEDIKVILGADGGTVFAAGALFQTPVTQKLSQLDSQRFKTVFTKLFTEYRAGTMDRQEITRIMSNHNVAHKVESMAQQGIGGDLNA